MRKLLSIFLLLIISFTVFVPAVVAEVYTVKMGSDKGELKFVPETLEIQPGDTVKWVMNKVPPHNVVFESDKIPNANKALAEKISHKKLLFAPGETYESLFSVAEASGTYPYYCEPHRGAGMVGKIIVKD
jgi:plastocyanin